MPLDVDSIYLDSHLAFSCSSLWIYLFGLLILAVEATNVYFFLLIILGPAVTYYIVKSIGIPQPHESLSLEIFGRQPKPDSNDKNSTEFSECDPFDSKEESGCIFMPVIAHRFAGLDAPENTIEALDLCYQHGAIGAEFDLVLTKDLVPIIFHDSELDRVTISTGEIQDKTWDELRQLDVSVNHPFHERFQGAKIPLFDDVIKKIIEYDMRIFIDVKDDRPEITNVILETFRKYPHLYKRAVVSSFNFFVVYAVRRRDPNIVVSMAWRPHYMSYSRYSPRAEECIPYSKSPIIFCWACFLDRLTTWFFNNLAFHLTGFSAVLIYKDVITPELVNYWRARNVRVIAWTVNTPLEKLHLLKNIGVACMSDSMIGT